jgi:uncharacterized membrane protein YebE (DUF533 family)
MFDVEKLLGQMLAGGMGSGKKRKSRGGSFGIPGVSKAQLGVGAIGLAIAAWDHYKSRQGQAAPAMGGGMPAALPAMGPPPPPPPPMSMPAPTALPSAPPAAPQAAAPPSEDSQRAADATHLIRAMIAAAHADGLIDAEERAQILERALEAGLDATTREFLKAELRQPASLEQIVAATAPHLKLETYAAALVAISIDTDAERAWLDRLATALGLDTAARGAVHQQLGVNP